MKGAMIKVQLAKGAAPGQGAALVAVPPAPVSSKRTRSNPHPPEPSPPPHVLAPVEMAVEPSISGGSSSSSSSHSFVDQPIGSIAVSSLEGSALLAAAAAGAAHTQSLETGMTIAEQAEAAAAAAAAVSAAAASAAPAAKRQKMAIPANESKIEKERRLNRVGLSYRCGRCGQPKKGHVCNGVGEGGELGAEDVGLLGAALAPAEPKEKKVKKAKKEKEPKVIVSVGDLEDSPTGQWALDSESIFKDIKTVLQTPGGEGKGSSKAKASGSKRRKKDEAKAMPPPPVLAEKAAEKSALLEELDIAMQRPPSLITPEDGDNCRAGPSSMNPPPSSLVSASDMFSPGQLMTHLLGTPTPAITPGLSPGTLNELGNMLQSPGAMLASARKAQEATLEGAIETPGQA